MPGKRLSALFSDFDFSFLGCGNPVSSPDDEKYLKHCNAPVKRAKEPFSSKMKKSIDEGTEPCDLKSIRERPLSRDELLFDLEVLQNNLKNLDIESSLMDDIVHELSLLNPENTLLKKSISMPTLCITEDAPVTSSISKSLSIANTRNVEMMKQRTR